MGTVMEQVTKTVYVSKGFRIIAITLENSGKDRVKVLDKVKKN